MSLCTIWVLAWLLKYLIKLQLPEKILNYWVKQLLILKRILLRRMEVLLLLLFSKSSKCLQWGWSLYNWFGYIVLALTVGVCAGLIGRVKANISIQSTGLIGRVKANISIQSATNRLEKFQFAIDPPKSKSGWLVTNFGGFNSVG